MSSVHTQSKPTMHNSRTKLKKLPTAVAAAALVAAVLALSLESCQALLIQPYNYMLADDALAQLSSAAIAAEDSELNQLARDSKPTATAESQLEGDDTHLSRELAELINEKQQRQARDGLVAESVADILLGAMAGEPAAAASVSAASQQQEEAQPRAQQQQQQQLKVRADYKEPQMWYNPKEIIPALRISAMATPSKYKKVYFRAEKKLVDGAFKQRQDGSADSQQQHQHQHQQQQHNEQLAAIEQLKEALLKPFKGAAAFDKTVSRRVSRGSTAIASPPGIFDNGVVDFLKKFRDVYIQTRPVQTAAASPPAASSPSSFASLLSAAASSPALSAVLAPSSLSSKPSQSTSSAIATAAANAVVNAVAGGSQQSSPSSSPASSTQNGAASTNANKSPLSAQNYVSFWSKTFPNWVRKMLKQMRRRSLQNSSKRQHQKQSQHAASIAQQAAGALADSMANSQSSGSSSSSSSSSSPSSSSSSSASMMRR